VYEATVRVRVFVFTVALASVTVCGVRREVAAQASPTLGWAGWARCDIAVQGPGYRDQQTHTWTMTGGTPSAEGAFRVYAATWTVAGGGSLQRTTGTQTLTAQWATNVPATNAPLAVFARASDGRMFVQARHAQLQAGAIEGYQQLTIDGKPQTPSKLSSRAFEWAFPLIDVDTQKGIAVGSSTPPVTGPVGPMQPAGAQATASCTWQFARGSSPAPPAPVPARMIPTPPTNSPQAPAAPTLTVVPVDPAVIPLPQLPVPAPTLTTVPVGPALVPTPVLCQRRPPTLTSRQPLVSPKRVEFFFSGVEGATGYTVYRDDLGALTSTRLPPLTPATAVSSYVHSRAFRAPLDAAATYTYTIRAHYGAACGDASFTVRTPKVSQPTLNTPNVAGGKVTIRGKVADPQQDFTGVIVTGALLPPAGKTLLSIGPHVFLPIDFSIVGVPAGEHSWTFTTFYDIPGGRVTGDPLTVKVIVP
jgi:hypothetical protein